MNRSQYQQARRLIRDNGRIAYRWIANQHGQELAGRLRTLSETDDWLAVRADIVHSCGREGRACTVKHTRPESEYRAGRWIGVAGNIHKSI